MNVGVTPLRSNTVATASPNPPIIEWFSAVITNRPGFRASARMVCSSKGEILGIQGESRSQTSLLPVSLEELMTKAHLIRVICLYVAKLDLVQLGFDKARPKSTGRPCYDPGDQLKKCKRLASPPCVITRCIHPQSARYVGGLSIYSGLDRMVNEWFRSCSL